MNLAALLQVQVDAAGKRPALIHGAAWCSFAGLEDASARGATLLERLGVRPGDHVLVLTPMGLPLYEVLLACWRLGAVALVVDPAAGAGAFAHAVERLQPRVFIGSSTALLLRWLRPVLRRIPRVLATGFPWWYGRWAGYRRHPPQRGIAPVAPDAPALITFTSGSTGAPKGAVRSHGLLAAQHALIARTLEHQAGAVEMATLPIFALASLASGMTTVIPPVDLGRVGRVAPRPVLAQLHRHGVRSATASPAFFARLLSGAPLPLRRAFTGGAPVFPGLWARLAAALPAGEAVAVYGSTEAEPIAHAAFSTVSTEDLAAMAAGRGLLAGPVVRETDCRILATRAGEPLGPLSAGAFAAAGCALGEPGEIVVAGAHVLPGYLDGVGDATSKIAVDGRRWHRTGDCGFFDAAGRLWLLGRQRAVITDDHGRCHPFAVEAAACSRAGIRRAACVGRGGRRVLVVEGDPVAVELDDLRRRFHLDRIVPLRIPLDRRHNAKVDYPALHRMLDRHGIGETPP